MSTDSLPRARSSVEVLGSPQGGRERVVACVYWIGMLFMAGLLIDRWFDDDMGPDHPAYALLVDNLDVLPHARRGHPRCSARHATSASPLVPRPRGRARTSPHAGRRQLRLAARALRMESPCRRPPAGIRWHQGRLTLPGTVCARRYHRPRRLLCRPLAISAAALFTGHPWGALWILLPGVVLHLYPVLLQRSIMLRLQPLLNEPSIWDFGLGAAKR